VRTRAGDSQFFDKFNVRHTISVLLQYLMSFPPHILAIAGYTQCAAAPALCSR
jgi:hypothetical protein